MFTHYKNLTQQFYVFGSTNPIENLRAKEVEFISEKAEAFINQWTRHGDDLKGSFTIKYNQFLVLAVDESFNNVSGCSIDSSVRFVQGLTSRIKIGFNGQNERKF